MPYTVDFKCEDIFSDKHPYKIHCIGKCTKGATPTMQDNKYFFLSHGMKYEVHERLRTLNDIKITIEKVEEFDLPTDYDRYEIFQREESYGYKYDLLQKLAYNTYSKDGFYIFQQMCYNDQHAAIGGIVDIYVYKSATRRQLADNLKKEIYDREK